MHSKETVSILSLKYELNQIKNGKILFFFSLLCLKQVIHKVLDGHIQRQSEVESIFH